MIHMKGKRNVLRARESLKQFGSMLIKGFPSLHWTIEDIVAEKDKVWVRTTMTGTLFPISLA